MSITIDEDATESSLKLICNNIRDKYSKFSNIIICIYSSDEIGIKLAKGFDV